MLTNMVRSIQRHEQNYKELHAAGQNQGNTDYRSVSAGLGAPLFP